MQAQFKKTEADLQEKLAQAEQSLSTKADDKKDQSKLQEMLDEAKKALEKVTETQ